VTLTITCSTLVAGFLAQRLTPGQTIWSLVALAAVAAFGWIIFARPIWRGTAAPLPDRAMGDVRED